MIPKPKQDSPLKVGMISLGCAKNLVDAEIMLGSLIREGVEITNDPAGADVIIVNTCSFIDSAQEESVDTILESVQVREAEHRGQGLVVAGCLPQRFREDLPKLFPEVDAFMGIDQVAQAGNIVRQALANRLQKISTGADKKASSARRVSRQLAELEKARPLAESGTSLRGTPEFGTTRRTVVTAEEKLPGKKSAQIPGPLLDVHARPTFIPDFETPRFRLTPRHFAYVKIAEGCNHPCSFCIIPQMRGSHRSRQQQDVVAECKGLLADGVKELNLISQDSTYYGIDLRPNHSRAIAAPASFNAAVQALAPGATTISTLIRELNTLPGDFWIRLLYTHPAHWTDELIQAIAASRKVARYIDIPLQHIHPNLLERMRRETTREYIVDLIARIRRGVPGIAIRTTFIVGFPGETDAAFESLLDFIRETRFDRLGVFAYSKEDGTRAGRMAGQIPDKVKQERRDAAMAAQQEISSSISASQVGKTLQVLVEREATRKELQAARVDSWEHGLIRSKAAPKQTKAGGYLIARSEGDAPDIDGRVYVRGRLPISQFAKVRIVGHTDYDLIAEAVK